VPDSSYWFNESWTGYLATRFLFAFSDTNQTLQLRERSHLLAHALDFFPALPIASGRSGGINEKAVFTYKGRYVFMMLEYILGRDVFDSVIRTLYRESASQTPSITRFQALCEAAYGSPLSWFFDEWLYRTGFPEYVLTSQTQATPRGTYEVDVTVTQRGDLFSMPLNIYVETAARSFLKRIFVSQEQQRFTFIFPSPPVKIEWNPQYLVLRWVQHFRILAHARTSVSYRVFNRDLASSEREAHLTLQLDPDNTIGANPIALFSLGKAAGARKEWVKAEAYFLDASNERVDGEYAFYPLLSAVRRANILDFTGRREEALTEYKKALSEAQAQPLLYAKVIVEARKFLEHPFVPSDDAWFEMY
jgi:tetratricopeptide (TPR) repeat protein